MSSAPLLQEQFYLSSRIITCLIRDSQARRTRERKRKSPAAWKGEVLTRASRFQVAVTFRTRSSALVVRPPLSGKRDFSKSRVGDNTCSWDYCSNNWTRNPEEKMSWDETFFIRCYLIWKLFSEFFTVSIFIILSSRFKNFPLLLFLPSRACSSLVLF